MNNCTACTRATSARLLSLTLVFLLTTGCASILKGTTQAIPVNSDPDGADILVDGNLVGTTPSDVEFKRKRDHLVVIEKKNYQSKSVAVVKDVGGAVWGNILAGGLIGWGVDAATGAQYNLTPKTIHVRLEPLGEGSSVADSGQDSSIAIKKLNDLDQMLDDKQISDEEYTRARIALLKEYFPDMVPDTDEVDGDVETTNGSDTNETDTDDSNTETPDQ